MEEVSVVDAKKRFSDLMSRVAYGGQRIVIERHGKPMMAWVSIEDLNQLVAFETDLEETRSRRELALTLAAYARQFIRQERRGVHLPDSVDILNELRQERLDELADLR